MSRRLVSNSSIPSSLNSFIFMVVKQPSRDGVLETSSAQVVCQLRAAEIHARPIPARHRAQTKCCRAARLRPKTRAGLYPYPCAFPVDATLLVYPGNTDPQFSLALHVASERDAGSFQLCVGDPR